MFSIPSEVRAICFDAVGTLIYPSPNASDVYAEVGSKFGTKNTITDVKIRFLEAFLAQEQLDKTNQWKTNESRERERWKNIVANVFDDVVLIEQCFAELWEHFALPTSWGVFDDVPETLQFLHRSGYQLGIASNYDSRLRPVLAGHACFSCVEDLFISAEMMWRKPGAQFFEVVAQKLGLEPAEVLFVGDDVANDLEGARQAGMHALLISRDGKHDGLRSLQELCESK